MTAKRACGLLVCGGVAFLIFLMAAISVQAQENKKEAKPAAIPPVRHAPAEQAPQQRQHQAAPETRQAPSHPAPPAQPRVQHQPEQRQPPPSNRPPVYQRHDAPQNSPSIYQRHDAPQNSPSVYQRHDAPQNSPSVYQRHDAPQNAPSIYQRHDGPQNSPSVFQRHDAPAVGRPGPPPRMVTTRSGAVVYHSPSGVRRVEVVRPGGRVVVAGAPGHGYVQRQIVIGNRPIVKRTYIVNGVSYARVYRPVTYHGMVLHVYTPVRYYRPTFYAYAYNPWARPVVYRWGWASSPWYGYYGGYFTPYPVYASPTLWLTDYLVAATLEAAYQQRMAASGMPQGNNFAAGMQAPLTPEVKEQIAAEVRYQLERERAESQSPSAALAGADAPLFNDNVPHVFVAHASLGVMSNAGECTLGEGDVLQMNGAPPLNSDRAEIVVLASRGQDCPKGSVAMVQLTDLQEMHNRMRETIDRGLGDLHAKQGQNGIPALPAGAAGTIDSPYAAAAQPDPDAGTEVTKLARDSDAEERSIPSQDTGAAAPPTLSLGLSIDAVKAIQGEPQKIVDLGAKKIYVYKDLKITFTDGVVTDIQ